MLTTSYVFAMLTTSYVNLTELCLGIFFPSCHHCPVSSVHCPKLNMTRSSGNVTLTKLCLERKVSSCHHCPLSNVPAQVGISQSRWWSFIMSPLSIVQCPRPGGNNLTQRVVFHGLASSVSHHCDCPCEIRYWLLYIVYSNAMLMM